MKYLLLVSHGNFSAGLKQTLSMFAGDAANSVISIGLNPDESADSLEWRFNDMLENLPDDTSFVVLADIIGGSPLTTVCKVLSKRNKLDGTLVLGGMNFPMALTTLMGKDTMSNEDLKAQALQEAGAAMKEFNLPAASAADDDEDDI
ncbi:PTS sugar transporter subunit IIA [Lacticaseibacillus zhaodongensis]|uniref:PTS sugar transporter subunit IIA n=1 Tax=Lacticaseibacillus zhaodongensis TaxID=2668065 RepID=UPI0012D2C323|nr:PTS fructose transporter subunit IIA [Lacticaseibacillus zhaodongensis]